MDFELTVIIPVHNEENNLERVYQQMSAFMESARKKTKVLFINDGSVDGSLGKIREICSRSDLFRYCSFDRNYGLSAAIKAGFDYSDTPLDGLY